MRGLLLVALFAAGAFAPVAHAETTITSGHLDYAARVVDGALHSQVKDSATADPVYREVAETVIALGPSARQTLPASVRPASLGSPGARVWVIPQVQKLSVPWLGWNTEELTSAEVSGDVRWRLAAVQGPGAVVVFQTGAFGEVDTIFDSTDGLPDTRAVPRGVHAHGNWVFTQPGSYALRFEHTATRAGGAAETDTQTLRFTVTDEEAGAVPPGGDGGDGGGGGPGGGSGGGAGGGAGGVPDARDPARPAPGVAAPAPTLALRSARVRGRVLTLGVRLDRRSRMALTVRRVGRASAQIRPRTVPAGTRTLRVQLDRRLRRGTHMVRVRVSAAGRSTTRSIRVRVR